MRGGGIERDRDGETVRDEVGMVKGVAKGGDRETRLIRHYSAAGRLELRLKRPVNGS